MKKVLVLSCCALFLALTSCKKQEPVKTDDPLIITGTEGTIGWQDCVFFVNQQLTICFIGANEYRCPCNADCFWEGAVDATLRVTGPNGLDKTITLTTNSSPDNLHNSEVIDGKKITFLGTTDDCNNYGNYEKYIVNISVE